MLRSKFKIRGSSFKVARLGFLVAVCSLLAMGCRYDMQDQPRYEYYERSPFFANELASRPIIEGTVPRGYLREDKALFTGKKDTATISQKTLSSEGGKIETPGQNGSANQNTANQMTGAAGNRTTGAAGGNAMATYPDAVDEFPLPVTKELIDRGEERYKVFCIVCHGPNGEGNGMVVRRGYTQPPSYMTEQLRGAPVGHFYDVITNGFGRMNGYAAQIPVADRWAIVAYIRALQAANPNLANQPAGGAPVPAATQQTQTQTPAPAPQNGGNH